MANRATGEAASRTEQVNVLSILDIDSLLHICRFVPNPRDAAWFCDCVPAVGPLFWNMLLWRYGYKASMRVRRPTNSFARFIHEVEYAKEKTIAKVGSCWGKGGDRVSWYGCNLDACDCVTIHVQMEMMSEQEGSTQADEVEEINMGENLDLLYKDVELLMKGLCLVPWPRLKRLTLDGSHVNSGFMRLLMNAMVSETFPLTEIYMSQCLFESDNTTGVFYKAAVHGALHNLEVLNLTNCQMDVSRLQWFVDAMPYMSSLKKISLRGNNAPLRAVYDMLSVHTSGILQSLVTLELDDHLTVREIFTLMKEFKKLLPLLTFFGHEGMKVLSTSEAVWLHKRVRECSDSRSSDME